VNNAGVSLGGELDREIIEQHLAVNLFGTLDVIQGFLPALTNRKGAIVSVLSLAAVASVPFDPNYSISKGAGLSLIQVLRSARGTWRECPRRPARPGRHGHDPPP
jgi:short-subunit dehydrogenase